ncbi:MAG: KAP family NTPase [Bacteroidales bacterium]|nr:KAP family NTPase [Bacteroidales bacterium]
MSPESKYSEVDTKSKKSRKTYSSTSEIINEFQSELTKKSIDSNEIQELDDSLQELLNKESREGNFTLNALNVKLLLELSYTNIEQLVSNVASLYEVLLSNWKSQEASGNLNKESLKNYVDVVELLDIKVDIQSLKDLHQTVFDSVPNQTDEPVVNTDQDMLGRAAFAKYLVQRLISTDIGKGAYAIHLYGPWGSGKSTVLNFLKWELKQLGKRKSSSDENDDKLKKRDNRKWLIVDFNAWQNQHVNQPWWLLYSKIFRKARWKIGFFSLVKEYAWRLSTGQLLNILIVIGILWATVLIFRGISVENQLNLWAKRAKELSEIIALFTTIAGAVIGLSRSLIFGSAKSAENYKLTEDDPMTKIQLRFGKLIKRLNRKYRLVVFIDDLDRCNSDYVVGLLEGVQTLFRQGSIVFVVAADRTWLNACFEQGYSEFKTLVSEPGKSLGTLFLEKTFQLATSVPDIPYEFKVEYWNQLIQVNDSSFKEKVNEYRKSAQQKINKVSNDEEMDKAVKESVNKSAYEQLAIREEAVVQLASPEIIERTEHTLKHFIPFLDNNPRSMKRLVNMYSVNRARAILSFLEIDLKTLAHWTILQMRWPILVYHLKENPSDIEKIGANKNYGSIGSVIAGILINEDVIRVIDGNGILKKLTKEDIEVCSKLL